MGLLTTVMKKSETPVNTTGTISPNDEKKILMNINSRMDDLKTQNLQNAKFLRGISRKIETELSQMREMEENKSIEVYDDSALVESINRVEQSLLEINNNEIAIKNMATGEQTKVKLDDISKIKEIVKR